MELNFTPLQIQIINICTYVSIINLGIVLSFLVITTILDLYKGIKKWWEWRT